MKTNWSKEVSMPVTVCDKDGVILEMNNESVKQFKKDGGDQLIGRSLINCHPEPSRSMLVNMLKTHTPHFLITREGSDQFLYHEFPWFEDGEYMGFVEISLKIPGHFECGYSQDVIIYHIAHQPDWEEALSTGVYYPPAYDDEHFIHCSTEEHVIPVAERYYPSANDLVLLKIRIAKLTSSLAYENLDGGEQLFPHIYGPLNLDAVEEVRPLVKNPAGNYVFPF